MTNEERLEARLIDAHSRGYYDDAVEKVSELRNLYPRLNRYDIYDLALNECKSKWEQKIQYDN